MTVFALVLYAFWLAFGFGLRMAIQRRRTGDTGMRVAALPRRHRIISEAFAASLVAGFVGVILDLTDSVELIDALDTGAVAGVGVVLAVIGVTGTFLTQLSMGDSWRIGVDQAERTALVTGGPFSVVRNPIYSSMVLAAVGLSLMVPNAVTLGGAVALVVALELQVRVVEEPYLRSTHGPEFARYCARVGRFVPGLGRRRAT